MRFSLILFKGIRKIYSILLMFLSQILSYMLMKLNGVIIGKGFCSRGIPFVNVVLNGSFEIGNNFTMNNGERYNPIGRQQRCIFCVEANAVLKIGNNVGISSTSIVCKKKITIGDYVKIGGNVVIYDTDFHSLDPNLRKYFKSDKNSTCIKEVTIERNVFIGAHSTILKGVHIGENSIIGAGSLVTKSIPDNEIWGGNPAKFIRKLE